MIDDRADWITLEMSCHQVFPDCREQVITYHIHNQYENNKKKKAIKNWEEESLKIERVEGWMKKYFF